MQDGRNQQISICEVAGDSPSSCKVGPWQMDLAPLAVACWKTKMTSKLFPLNQNVTFISSLKHPLFADLFSVVPHPPASHSFVSELMFPVSTLRRPWLFVRQSELMQICKLFPFVKCQKNTCKSLALALSCQLALLEAGDKWQSITQHAFKERGDLFQNSSIRAAFNNISKIRSQHQFFFLPLFLPLLLNEWQHNIWELFKALGISIPLPTIWESDGIMGTCQKCYTLSGEWLQRHPSSLVGGGAPLLTPVLQVALAPTFPLPTSLQVSALKLVFCLPLLMGIMLHSLSGSLILSLRAPPPPHP